MNARDKEDIRILRAAKRSLLAGRERYICVAVQWRCCCCWSDYARLHGWVESMLNGEKTLNDWMQIESEKTYHQICDTHNGWQLYRAAWIDYLIEQIEKGKV